MAVERTRITRHQKVIAEALRALRKEAGVTLEQVGALPGFSASKVSRIENAQRGCDRQDLSQLLDLYEAAEDVRRRLLVLSGEPTNDDDRWWHSYLDVVSSAYVEYLGLEADAAEVTEYQPLLMPGLLQTEAYAAAVELGGAPSMSEDRLEALVRIRMRRRARLTDDASLVSLNFVTEAALHVEVGGRHVLLDQLAHLQAMAKHDNVTILVVPNTAGALGAYASGFTVFGFSGDGGEVVSTEAVGGALVIDAPEGVARFRGLIARLHRNSLSAEASSALIARVRDNLERT